MTASVSVITVMQFTVSEKKNILLNGCD